MFLLYVSMSIICVSVCMLLQIMCRLGNSKVNAILEYELPEHVKKPSPTTPRSGTTQRYVNCGIFNEKH